ncbi:MAG: 30S ribosomal protein S16 [Pirellulaceae bacterium]
MRLKKMGRKARPFFRLCAVDSRKPRDGKVIEELGYYDPMVRETDARVVLKADRVDYWLGVGAQPTEKAGVLIKKYGSSGTHLEQQRAAMERMKTRPSQSSAPAKPAPAPVVEETTQATEEAAAE